MEASVASVKGEINSIHGLAGEKLNLSEEWELVFQDSTQS